MTLIELIVVVGILAVLATMVTFLVGRGVESARHAQCASSLRQLGMAVHLYLNDHDQSFFRYLGPHEEGRMWYFGLERFESIGQAEGDRELDRTVAPLYPYIQHVGGIEICPSFPYDSALWKPKFKGASYGYGFNTSLSGRNTRQLASPSKVIVFGDCAQVNNFQAPASRNNPMLEEFYMIDAWETTIHFRHSGRAMFLFLDGHVRGMEMYPGTRDNRLPEANVGRITPRGSQEYLR